MNVSDIAARVKAQFGDDAGIQVTDEMILRWCNDALLDFAIQYDLFPVRAVTPANVGLMNYGLPRNILRLEYVKYNGAVIKEYSDREAQAYIDQNEANLTSGDPQIFWQWAGEINLWPTPSTAGQLAIHYLKSPDDLLTITDDIPLGVEYRPRFVEYCLKQAYELDENAELAANKATELATGLNVMRRNNEPAPQDFYATISYTDDPGPWEGGDCWW